MLFHRVFLVKGNKINPKPFKGSVSIYLTWSMKMLCLHLEKLHWRMQDFLEKQR